MNVFFQTEPTDFTSAMKRNCFRFNFPFVSWAAGNIVDFIAELMLGLSMANGDLNLSLQNNMNTTSDH